MGVVIAPILEGKVDMWKQWIEEMNSYRKEALTDFNRFLPTNTSRVIL